MMQRLSRHNVRGFARTAVFAAVLAGLSQTQALAADDQALRLETIGFRLGKANAGRCQDPQMLTGLMLHNIGGYNPADRQLIRDAYGLGLGFGVLGVVPDSPGARSGLREGDEIVMVNGQDVTRFAPEMIGGSGSYDRTEAFVSLLDRTLRSSPASVTVRRGNGTATLTLAGVPGCGGRMVLMPRHNLNAWSNGRYVAVTEKMMEFAADDDELAFVVAHEMAHNMLDHAGKLRKVPLTLAWLGIGAGKIRRTEVEADDLAVSLMASTGLDTGAPARMLARTAKAMWLNFSFTHPGFSRRIEIVNAAAARIAEEQASTTRTAQSTPWPSRPERSSALAIQDRSPAG